MKKAILFLMLCLAGAVGFAACAESEMGEEPADITMSERGQELQSGDASCQTSSGDPCFCGTAGCDGEPGGGTGGGTGGGGGGTGGGGGGGPYPGLTCWAISPLHRSAESLADPRWDHANSCCHAAIFGGCIAVWYQDYQCNNGRIYEAEVFDEVWPMCNA